jgi:hypothetical protein
METIKKDTKHKLQPVGTDFFKHSWEESWTYIKTVVDVMREPVVILDQGLRVMAANESFYRTFQVEPKDTENKVVYELGNGQWNIPDLRRLLQDILPNNTFFKGFEVTHEFPFIGRKVMILNARQIHFKGGTTSKLLPPIILLAMEDVSEIMVVAETLASHANQLEGKLSGRIQKLEKYVGKLEKEVIKSKNNQQK